MIALLAVAVVAGVAAGRIVGWWSAKKRSEGVDVTAAAVQTDAPVVADLRLVGFPCALGDVVLLAHGEEAWLAGAVLFRESASDADESGDVERTVGALFIAPDKGGDHAVYARPVPNGSLDWMWPLPPDALAVGREPPSAIEYEGERFERVCRVPLALACVGTGAPDLGPSAIIGEYRGGAGARLLVVIGARATAIWRGRRLEDGMYDVLPKG